MRGAIIGGEKLRYLHRATVAEFATVLQILFSRAADVGEQILRQIQEKRSCWPDCAFLCADVSAKASTPIYYKDSGRAIWHFACVSPLWLYV